MYSTRGLYYRQCEEPEKLNCVLCVHDNFEFTTIANAVYSLRPYSFHASKVD